MKANNFIEFHCNSFNKCEAGEITIQEHYNQMEDAGVFYSQLFKPELIEKYFEDAEGIKKLWRKYHYGLEPKTLDSFITDGIRCKIELSFNKTALQELNIHELKGENQSHEQ